MNETASFEEDLKNEITRLNEEKTMTNGEAFLLVVTCGLASVGVYHLGKVAVKGLRKLKLKKTK